MNDLVKYARHGTVGVISVNNPPVNALSQGVREGLSLALDEGAADAEARALVVICEGNTFIAGADIREFGKPMGDPRCPRCWTSWRAAPSRCWPRCTARPSAGGWR